MLTEYIGGGAALSYRDEGGFLLELRAGWLGGQGGLGAFDELGQAVQRFRNHAHEVKADLVVGYGPARAGENGHAGHMGGELVGLRVTRQAESQVRSPKPVAAGLLPAPPTCRSR